ncbi:glyoxalase family protein [Ophiocordyceps sinensis CO18]|uniref:Glyoxalase family protein n=1 Tax=Ophiocordyceps sinensis (strain Co18 / CGMCC 3.14243) TaxID=911162 RepID=T5ABD7_OPHSC|nr:glyoxalase family protein [Ophiocordyceps sinensis CO18]
MGIDHTCLYVPEARFEEILKFYERVLEPLAYKVHMRVPQTAIVGLRSTEDEGPDADFWLIGVEAAPNHTSHIAFRAKNCPVVDDFHCQALKAGGKDNGPPGPRNQYGPKYYGAFVLDPAGNNIEAVFYKP